jgi:ferredoxin
MAKRKIIKIDEDKCTGCGECIPNCPEGALQIIDDKARLISDLFCDGLGACIGHCPEDAITVEEREAEPYDEKKVMGNIVKQGNNVIKAHLEHLKEHGEEGYLKQALDVLKKKGIQVPHHDVHAHGHAGCPGSKMMDLKKGKKPQRKGKLSYSGESQLTNWPVQIMLVPPFAPYLDNADLLIAADCVSFTYPGFHDDFLKGKVLLIGCPKLDNIDLYREKITQIVKERNIKSITHPHMEVPCCFGLVDVIKSAIAQSGKKIPFKEVVISIKGERLP